MNQHRYVTAPTLRHALERALAQVLKFVNRFPDSATVHVHHEGDRLAIDRFGVLEFVMPQEQAPALRRDDYPEPWVGYASSSYYGAGKWRYAINMPSPVLHQYALAIGVVRFQNGAAAIRDMTLEGFDELDGRVFLNYLAKDQAEEHIPGLPVTFTGFSFSYVEDVDAYMAACGCLPVPLDAPLWRVREALRMKYRYQPLPEPLLQVLPREVVDREFPHVAAKPGNAGLIAYTASEQAGIMDRQQVIKPGRYIRHHCPHLSDQQVKELAAEVAGALDAGIRISHDPDDFERVYMRGPSSCMAYGPDGKAFGRLMVDGEFFHPTRVYCHPENNIRLVWVEQGERIGARVVVNIARKQYSTIYGSDSVARARERLLLWLDANGYEQSRGALHGEKLLKVSPDDYPDAIICPYIDPQNQGVEVYDDYLLIPGPHGTDHETGCLAAYNTYGEPEVEYTCCADCDGDVPVEDTYTTFNDRVVCETCRDDYYREAYNLRTGYVGYEDNNSCDLYELHATLAGTTRYNFQDYVVCSDPQEHGLVILSNEHYSHGYGDGVVAREIDCVRTDNDEWILTRDAADFGYFIHEEEDVAYPEDEWAILIDEDGEWELIRRVELDEDCTQRSHQYPTDCPYPMLPCYEVVPEDEEEPEPEEVA